MLERRLLEHDHQVRPLRGIRDHVARSVLIDQMLESIHRVRYVGTVRGRQVSPVRIDPGSPLFDPLKAAILCQHDGDIDEACWLVFLFVHFGKNRRGGWRYVQDVYGRLGDGCRWNWQSVSTNVSGFRQWLDRHQADIRSRGPGGFGNHRKYQSLDAWSSSGTGAAVASYVDWVSPPRDHEALLGEYVDRANGDPRRAFDVLYYSLSVVASFGRTAKFDYLTMIGKLGLAPIVPGIPYLSGATGPLAGARLLYSGSSAARVSAAVLDQWLAELDLSLGVGMQVLEDALCNWQKNPRFFRGFRG
jgi:hypothetical protein